MKVWRVPRTASRGYAIAPVYKVTRADAAIDERRISPQEADAEIRRFENAVQKALEELQLLAKKDAVFDAHCVLVRDASIYNGVSDRIRNQLMNAEAALSAVCESYVQMFERMENEYMRERADDMRDIEKRLLYAMKGMEEKAFDAMTEKCIVVAKNLMPSDTAKLDLNLVSGIITENGGVNSHVSIMARNLGIPCLVGVGSLLSEMRNGMMAVLDAEKGMLYLDPDSSIIAEYGKKEEEWKQVTEAMRRLSVLPSETTDGHRFRICVNVGNINDIQNALRYQIDGVGLFRTEVLYMENDHLPTEEEQFQIYKEAAQLLRRKILTIRTLDIGGDKGLEYLTFPEEDNPFLGYRAIRLCLDRQDLFKTQLRAILRASDFGHLRIMYPMMISVEELEAANGLLELCKAELREEGISFDEEIQVGMMIETPAAVMLAEDFAKRTDFFSIGTNDLTQYLLAVDRGNQKVAGRYNTFHPAVLRAIAHVIKSAHGAGIPVGMCGEFAGDEKAAALLLGMGLDEFSMPATIAANVKYQLRAVSYEKMQRNVQEVLGKPTLTEVMQWIENNSF